MDAVARVPEVLARAAEERHLARERDARDAYHGAEDAQDHLVHDALQLRQLRGHRARVAHEARVLARVGDDPEDGLGVAERRAAQQELRRVQRDLRAPGGPQRALEGVHAAARGLELDREGAVLGGLRRLEERPPARVGRGPLDLQVRLAVDVHRLHVGLGALARPEEHQVRGDLLAVAHQHHAAGLERAPLERLRGAGLGLGVARERHGRRAVHLLVGLVALEVLEALLRRRERQHEGEHAHGAPGRDGVHVEVGELADEHHEVDDEEVLVRRAPELLEEALGHEGERRVLVRADAVVAVLLVVLLRMTDRHLEAAPVLWRDVVVEELVDGLAQAEPRAVRGRVDVRVGHPFSRE
mmetsp:Transcript_21814/g.65380  ORF Transcript_21814/g.65380 Transcript_21814/m.65380 type:complete len:356 (+) Transcript_21814:2600-3667(+)